MYKVYDLIDSKVITFAPNGLNIYNNHMPPHNKTNMNMVEMDNGRRLVAFVDELKTSFIEIKNMLIKSDAFPVCTTTCEQCLIDPQHCKILKTTIQNLMDQGILLIDHPSTIEEVSTLEIQYDEVLPLQIPYNLSQMTLSATHITPMVITISTSFPYNNIKEIPWVYDSTVYIHGQKMQENPMTSNEPIISIAATDGGTRSSRISVLTSLPTDNSGPSAQDKGKQIDNSQ